MQPELRGVQRLQGQPAQESEQLQRSGGRPPARLGQVRFERVRRLQAGPEATPHHLQRLRCVLLRQGCLIHTSSSVYVLKVFLSSEKY